MCLYVLSFLSQAGERGRSKVVPTKQFPAKSAIMAPKKKAKNTSKNSGGNQIGIQAEVKTWKEIGWTAQQANAELEAKGFQKYRKSQLMKIFKEAASPDDEQT